MKFQRALLLILATLVIAYYGAKKSFSGLLRGSSISNIGEKNVGGDLGLLSVNDDQKHRKSLDWSLYVITDIVATPTGPPTQPPTQLRLTRSPTQPPSQYWLWRPPITDNLYWKPVERRPTTVPTPTQPPTLPPTPVPAPTLAPIRPRTQPPSPGPLPTHPPTQPPTSAPNPTLPPTQPPTQLPTPGPPPTLAPTRSPTQDPSPGPSPTSPPTLSPTRSPTRLPTQFPSPKPPPTLPPTPPPTRPPTPTQAPILPIREENFDRDGDRCGMSTSGTVILHGGIFNYDNPMSDSLGQAIVREMRTNGDNRVLEPLVFVPGARRDVSAEDEITFENQWRNIMAPGVPFSVLHPNNIDPQTTNVNDAAQADTSDFVRPLTNAMGVFLPGGRQSRFIDAYKYTQTEEELWGVLHRGGVIAGTSAGAAVMADVMPRGDPSGSGILLSAREWYRHGLGFVSNIAIDNHIDSRGRELAMYDVLNNSTENRKILGIGLNENTLIVVKGRYFQVQGDRGVASVVRVYDCSQINAFETCNFANAPYLQLTVGDWYDLCDRRQLPGSPSSTELEADLNMRSVVGAYGRPWSFGSDFKAGNPRKFICSGRFCRFKATPIVVDTQDRAFVQISGTVYKLGPAFRSTDRLAVRYRINDSLTWRTIFRTTGPPSTNDSNGQSIFNALQVAPGVNTIYIEIEAETNEEGRAEFQVTDLTIE